MLSWFSIIIVPNIFLSLSITSRSYMMNGMNISVLTCKPTWWTLTGNYGMSESLPIQFKTNLNEIFRKRAIQTMVESLRIIQWNTDEYSSIKACIVHKRRFNDNSNNSTHKPVRKYLLHSSSSDTFVNSFSTSYPYGSLFWNCSIKLPSNLIGN